MSEEMRNCPGCRRHCDLSNPGCPRGEAYARGEEPSRSMTRERSDEQHNHDRSHGHGEHHGHGGHRHEHEEDSEDHEKRHARHRGIFGTEQYEELDLEGKLFNNLQEVGHIGRFRLGGRGGQNKILRILAEKGEMTQRDLTEKLGIQPGSASEVIGKLERAGFVERRANEHDRRAAKLCLTEKGEEEMKTSGGTKPPLFTALNQEEKEQLLSILEKLLSDWQSAEKKKEYQPCADSL